MRAIDSNPVIVWAVGGQCHCFCCWWAFFLLLLYYYHHCHDHFCLFVCSCVRLSSAAAELSPPLKIVTAVLQLRLLLNSWSGLPTCHSVPQLRNEQSLDSSSSSQSTRTPGTQTLVANSQLGFALRSFPSSSPHTPDDDTWHHTHTLKWGVQMSVCVCVCV